MKRNTAITCSVLALAAVALVVSTVLCTKHSAATSSPTDEATSGSAVTATPTSTESSDTSDTSESTESTPREIKPITDDSEKINTLGLNWGVSKEYAKNFLDKQGFTTGEFSEDGYYLKFITSMMNQTWIGRLEFNDNNELFGFSLYLADPFVDKIESDNLTNNIIQAFYERYGKPSFTEQVESKDCIDDITSTIDNNLVYAVPFNGHDVTSICSFIKIDKNEQGMYSNYYRIGFDDDSLAALDDTKNYYSTYIAYVSDNYSIEQKKLMDTPSVDLESGAFSEEDSEMVPVSYYKDEVTGRRVILNPEGYEHFAKDLDTDKYFVIVDWETDTTVGGGTIEDEDDEDDEVYQEIPDYVVTLTEMKRLIASGEKTLEDFTGPMEISDSVFEDTED